MACRVATRLALVAVLVLGALVFAPDVHAADTGRCWDHAPRCDALVQLRADNGIPGLDQDRDLQAEAQAWAEQMASAGVLSHSPVSQVYGAETVGFAPDTATVLAAFMQSSCHDVPPDEPCPGHREILLDAGLRRVGIGHVWRGDTLWLAVRWDY